jgi:CheY-specific phosphatase CheX
LNEFWEHNMDDDLTLFDVNRNLSNALATAAGDVLETMFFTAASEEPTEDCGTDPPIRVRVRFQGTPSGIFAMDMPGASARTIAADFLGGESEEISQAQVCQVLCELANMICGTTLSRLDMERRFDLASPEVTTPDGMPPCDGIRRSLYLPEGPLTLYLSLGRANRTEST